MNYQKQYDTIINNATQENRKKNKEVYYEEHHIVPRCLDGSDEKSNKVLLTAREHFIVHKLLTLIYPHNSKIALAFHMITFDKNLGRKVSARDYEYARTICRKALLGNKNGNYGNKYTEETKRVMSEKAKGRIPWNKGRSERDKKEKELWKQIDRFFHPGIRYKQTDEDKRQYARFKYEEWRRNNPIKPKTEEQKKLANDKIISSWTEERRRAFSERVKALWTEEKKNTQKEAQKHYKNQFYIGAEGEKLYY